MNFDSFVTYNGEVSRPKTAFRLDNSPVKLRRAIKNQWPDLQLPAEYIIIPLEDFKVIINDLDNRRMTPHRKGALVTLGKKIYISQTDLLVSIIFLVAIIIASIDVCRLLYKFIERIF